MLAAATYGDDYDIFLKTNANFRILPGKCTEHDFKAFLSTLKAFQYLEFPTKAINEILTIVSSILHLGNICFTSKENGKCSIDDGHEGKFIRYFLSRYLINYLINNIVYLPL